MPEFRFRWPPAQKFAVFMTIFSIIGLVIYLVYASIKKKNEPVVTEALAAAEETQAAITPMSMLDRAISSGASVEVKI